MEVLIGKTGFLASAIERVGDSEELKVLGSNDFDLLDDNLPEIEGVYEADRIINAADFYPGVSETKDRAVEVYTKNVHMYENLFAFAVKNRIKKVVTIGTTGCYPVTDTPLHESMFDGDPSRLNQKLVSYALSRFSLLDISALYKVQSGIEHSHLILPNFYGPGDKYEVGHSHLLASWIRDFRTAKEAGDKEIELWGPPTQKREFIYIDDAARYTLALGRISLQEEVLNVGTGTSPSYGQMAENVLENLDFNCKLTWDLSKKFPRQREVMDLTELHKYDSQLPRPTSFEEGLGITIKEFLDGPRNN